METMLTLFPWLLGGLALAAALPALLPSLRRVLCLAGRTAAGALALLLFDPLGAFIGVHLGVNLVNALLLGLLGAPGLGLLLMLNWTLQ